MKYKITIEELVYETPDSKRPEEVKIYSQVVEGLYVHKLVTMINAQEDESK